MFLFLPVGHVSGGLDETYSLKNTDSKRPKRSNNHYSSSLPIIYCSSDCFNSPFVLLYNVLECFFKPIFYWRSLYTVTGTVNLYWTSISQQLPGLTMGFQAGRNVKYALYVIYIYSNTCIYTIYIKGWIGMPAHEFCAVLMYNIPSAPLKIYVTIRLKGGTFWNWDTFFHQPYSTFTPSSHTTHFHSFFPIPYFHGHFPS